MLGCAQLHQGLQTLKSPTICTATLGPLLTQAMELRERRHPPAEPGLPQNQSGRAGRSPLKHFSKKVELESSRWVCVGALLEAVQGFSG